MSFQALTHDQRGTFALTFTVQFPRHETEASAGEERETVYLERISVCVASAD